MTDAFLRRAPDADAVLAAHDGSSGVLANPALHPLRSHPALTSAATAKRASRPSRRHLRILRQVAVQILRLVLYPKSSLAPICLAKDEGLHSGRPRVLFVGHRLPGRDGFSGQDVYFGAIPAAFDSVVLLIDHRPVLEALFSRREVAPDRVTLPQSLGLRGELRVLAQVVAGGMQLLQMRRSQPPGLRRELLTEAIARSAEAAAGLRIAELVGAACGQLRPEAMVITYEGYPWERLAFRAARTAAPGIVTLGYAHAGILPGVHALFRMLGADLDPDGLLAPGELARRQIERRLPGVLVELLGSPRRLDALPTETIRGPVCLVLPEGMASEVERLTRFALEIAQVRPDVEFRLRLHPVIAGDAALRALLVEVGESRNVHLSDDPFADDAARATWCLYRGSTAAVMAVAAGVTPLYLHVEGEAIIDPLGVDAEGRARSDHFVVDVSSGSDKLRRQESGDDPGHAALAAQYFSELTPDAIPRLIDRVRRARTAGQADG